jgi:hypothetical protein
VKVRLINQTETDGIIHRQAHLYAGAKLFCEADSLINITREDGRQKILKGKMGLGQVLTFMGVYTTFTLLDVGQDERSFWRSYHLDGPGIHFQIREVFPRALYLLEEPLGTTFHEVNSRAWDQLWSWLLEAEYVQELQD